MWQHLVACHLHHSNAKPQELVCNSRSRHCPEKGHLLTNVHHSTIPAASGFSVMGSQANIHAARQCCTVSLGNLKQKQGAIRHRQGMRGTGIQASSRRFAWQKLKNKVLDRHEWIPLQLLHKRLTCSTTTESSTRPSCAASLNHKKPTVSLKPDLLNPAHETQKPTPDITRRLFC